MKTTPHIFELSYDVKTDSPDDWSGDWPDKEVSEVYASEKEAREASQSIPSSEGEEICHVSVAEINEDEFEELVQASLWGRITLIDRRGV